jgi:hypothetical protein
MHKSMPADWTEAHVRRLFWRAGFGARPDEAERWAAAGKQATLSHVLNGGGSTLSGPKPHTQDGPLDPVNEWGHDVLWWLDRMVRSNFPLQEKMTLFWHDHFATRDQETPLMLAQNRMIRKNALGNFHKLLSGITTDEAMGLWLSLIGSGKWAPNENYARELMELFTLGKGYTERDIRQAARALTGWAGKWGNSGFKGSYWNKEAHDTGRKLIFHKRGNFGWHDVLDLVTSHKNHPGFIVEKLWYFFITQQLDAHTKARLVKVYKSKRLAIKPVVGAILAHPKLYANLDRPDMVKSPVVFLAGALRTNRLGIDRDSWVWLLDGMGQMPFRPPSVAGWDWGPAWMSTNTMKARFQAVTYLMVDDGPLAVKDGSTPLGLSPEDAVDRAWKAVGQPWIADATRRALIDMAGKAFSDLRPLPKDAGRWQQRTDMRERALRHLILSGPDAHLH